MDRETSIVDEFTRQADGIVDSPAFRSADVLSRISQAIGSTRAGRVLDLACGPGIVAESIAPIVDSITGVDATPRMVELAAARCRDAGFNNCVFHVASAEHLPFEDASFDIVTTRLSFHHFRNLSSVLAEVRRVLRFGGQLVAADVVASPDPEEADLHNALEQLRDPTHVRMHSAEELSRAIGSSGFEVLREETWRQRRDFADWARIVADPSRTAPLRVIMLALVRAGLHAGMELEETGGQIHFTHSWQLVIARRA